MVILKETKETNERLRYIHWLDFRGGISQMNNRPQQFEKTTPFQIQRFKMPQLFLFFAG